VSPRRQSGAADAPGKSAPLGRVWHLAWLRLRNFLRDWRKFPGWLYRYVMRWARENPYLASLAVYSLFRATGVTVRSGQVGLRFTLGRAGKVLEPGFHFLVPFVQRAKRLPSRSRTLELEDQTVVTLDGLVYRVQANVVWRVTDIRAALIQISDVEQGLVQALALTVQATLRESERTTLRVSPELDRQLEEGMSALSAPWGVVIENAGFQSIAPSNETLALVQLRQRVGERRRALGQLTSAGMGTLPAAMLLSSTHFPRPRSVRARRRESARRSQRRLALLQRQGGGWNWGWVPHALGHVGIGSAPR
jgi:hypothetical protein